MSEPAFASMMFPQLRAAQPDPHAQASGHAAGYAAGRREAELEAAAAAELAQAEADAARRLADEQLRSAVAALAAAADGFRARTMPLFDTLDAALLAAAVEIAEAMLQRELEDREGSALDAVRRALAGVGEEPVRRIRMNPADVARAGAVTSALEVIADSDIAPGDAVAELEHGMLDARLTNAVARVRGLIGGGAS